MVFPWLLATPLLAKADPPKEPKLELVLILLFRAVFLAPNDPVFA